MEKTHSVSSRRSAWAITPRIEEIVRLLSAVDSAKVTSNLWGERCQSYRERNENGILRGYRYMGQTSVIRKL